MKLALLQIAEQLGSMEGVHDQAKVAEVLLDGIRPDTVMILSR